MADGDKRVLYDRQGNPHEVPDTTEAVESGLRAGLDFRPGDSVSTGRAGADNNAIFERHDARRAGELIRSGTFRYVPDSEALRGAEIQRRAQERRDAGPDVGGAIVAGLEAGIDAAVGIPDVLTGGAITDLRNEAMGADTVAGLEGERQEHPWADLTGTVIGGAVTTGAAGAALGGAVTRGVLGGTVEAALARGLAPAAVRSAQVLGGTVGAAADAGMSEAALAIHENRPLTAESVLMNVGLGGFLGWGASKLATRGMVRGVQAVEGATPEGAAILRAGDSAFDEMLPPQNASIEELGQWAMRERAVRDAEISPMARAFNRAAGLNPGNNVDDLDFLAVPRNQVLAVEAPQRIDDFARSGAPLLNNMADMVDELEDVGRQIARLDSLDDAFQALPKVGSINASRQRIRAAMNVLDEATADTAANKLRGLGPSEEATRLRSLLSAAQEESAYDDIFSLDNPLQHKETYKKLLQLDKELQPFGDPEFLRTLRPGTAEMIGDIRRDINALTKDESIWGAVGRAQSERNMAMAEWHKIKDNLLEVTGRKDIASLSNKKVFDSGKLAQAIKSFSKVNGDRNYEGMVEMVTRANRLADAMQMFGADPAATRELSRISRQFLEDLAQVSDHVTALSKFNDALNRSNRAGGMGAVAGIGGASVGAVVAGPLGGIAGAAAGGAYTALSRPAHFYAMLGNMRKSLENVKKAMGMKLGKIEQMIAKAPKSGRPGSNSGAMAAAFTIRGRELATPEKRYEEYERIRDEMDRLANDPTGLVDRLTLSTAGVNTVDSAIGDAMSQRGVVALEYLNAHIPRPLMDPLFPHKEAAPASQTEVDSFLFRFKAADDPMSLLDDIAQMTLSVEGAEAARTIYPAMFQELGGEITKMLAKHDDAPYALRIQLGNLLDVPTDGSLEPSFMAAMQSNFAQTPAQSDANGAINGQSKSNLRIADSTMTRLQGLESVR